MCKHRTKKKYSIHKSIHKTPNITHGFEQRRCVSKDNFSSYRRKNKITAKLIMKHVLFLLKYANSPVLIYGCVGIIICAYFLYQRGDESSS
jgi:hypothetical protein